jgi:hypothetical protein
MSVGNGPSIDSRKELHGSLSPAVYSHHAREYVIPDINKLPFPEHTLYDPLELAKTLAEPLAYSDVQSEAQAWADGMWQYTNELGVFSHGYGDRHFTALVAGAFGEQICKFLRNSGAIEVPLSLADHAKMYQTRWFGTMANQLALTGAGMLGSFMSHQPEFVPTLFVSVFKFRKEPYVLEIEPESGLARVSFTKEAKAVTRSFIDRESSVGCPVARTSFTATPEQVNHLEAHGHLDEVTGFHAEGRLATSGLVKVTQGPRTAIDDVLWHWGDYVERYSKHLLAKGVAPGGIAPTSAGQVVLLE